MSSKPTPWGIPELIEHNGWTIWGWTGWKGTKTIARADSRAVCTVCDKPFVEGDVIETKQAYPPRHWLCVHPDNAPDRIMGQWLALKGEFPNARYIEVNVDNLVVALIDGREYKRGESFPISEGGESITEHTAESERERAKAAGFERLKSLIDQIEAK